MSTPPNQPTPDYGTLGPGSDIKMEAAGPPPAPDTREFKIGGVIFRVRNTPNVSGRNVGGPNKSVASTLAVAAILSGLMLMAGLLVATRVLNSTHQAQNELRSAARTSRGPVYNYSASTQKEVEQLLQRASRNDVSATTKIEDRATTWRGRIQLTPQLTNLITAGLNSNDMRVRAATVRLDLAAMNVSEDSEAVQRLTIQADSPDRATKIWALWTLGLLANRGIQTDHITDLLTAHLSDSDVEGRHWAVEGLAYVGSDATIPPLLKAMHDDPSPQVRERAACSLAQSGMLTAAQRRTVIPTLLEYADDTSLDVATRAWTFHALRDITAKNFPDDASKWREWYERNR